MKKIITLLLAGFSQIITAQTFDWATNIGGGDYDAGRNVSIDSKGNTYLSGEFNGLMDCDPNPNSSFYLIAQSQDGYIIKLDSNKNFIWAKQFGAANFNSPGGRLEVNAQDELIYTNTFRDSIDIDPGFNVHMVYSGNINGVTNNSYVVKLDDNGNFIWGKVFQSKSQVSIQDIAFDNQNNIYLSGRYVDTLSIFNLTGTTYLNPKAPNNYYHIKLDNNGEVIWFNDYYTTSGSNISSLNTAVDNNTLFFVGNTSDTLIANIQGVADTLPISTCTDVFIYQFDLTGNLNWKKKLTGSGCVDLYDISQFDNNRVYLSGSFSGSIDFDPSLTTLNKSSVSNRDYFILQLDVNGDLNWIKTYENSFNLNTNLGLNSNNNVFLTGNFTDTANFNDTLLIASPGTRSGFLVSLDSLGATNLGTKIGNRSQTYLNDIAIRNNAIYLIGSLMDSINYQYFGGQETLISNGSWDIFSSRIRISNNHTTQRNKQLTFDKVNIYPNPVNDILTIDGLYNDYLNSMKIKITDLNGKVIPLVSIENTIQTNSLNKGVYFLHITHNSKHYIKRFIKN